MSTFEVTRLRKEGRLDEAFALAQAEYEANPDDVWAWRALAWCHDARCKGLAETYKSRPTADNLGAFLSGLDATVAMKPDEAEDQLCTTLLWRVVSVLSTLGKNPGGVDVPAVADRVFAAVRDLHPTRPGEAYSALFNAFHRLRKDWSGYVGFCDWWNFQNFRPEDFVPETYNGRQQPVSLAEGAYIAYAKALLAAHDGEGICAFLPRIEELADAHPEMTYPGYYVGKLLLAIGQRGEAAVATLRPFLVKKRSEFWAWQLMAEALPETDDLSLACLLRAVHCRTPEHFLTRVRGLLAGRYLSRGDYVGAREQIDLVADTCRKEQQRVPHQVELWQREGWYAEAGGKGAATKIDWLRLTDDFLYADRPSCVAVVVGVNAEKKVVHVVYGRERQGHFKQPRGTKLCQPGDVLDLRMGEVSPEGRIELFTATKREGAVPQSDYCRWVAGEVTANGAHTAHFVGKGHDRVFIPPQVMTRRGWQEGELVGTLAVYAYNPKRNEWAWRIV